MELTATPQQPLRQHLLHRRAENESLDLTRLVSHLLLPPASLPRGRYPLISREEQLAAEMELLGLSQAAASGVDSSNHYNNRDNRDNGILRTAGDSNTGTGGVEGEAAVAVVTTTETVGAAAGLDAEVPVGVGVGVGVDVDTAGPQDYAATAFAAVPIPTAPAAVSATSAASAPAVPFWRQASRAPSSTTRVIALTSPDQQEVMLAVHRSIPPTPSFR